MHSWVRRVSTLASLFALVLGTASAAAAQGVASSSISGAVTQEGGRPVDGANVTVINTLTGQRFQLVTRATGRYTFENLPPGGPYTVEVRAIGFQAARRSGVNLTLGQRLSADFSLAAQVVEVQDLVVQGEADPIINRGRTGAASTVSDSAVQNLPSINRSFTDLITTSPAVSAGPSTNARPSIGGANNRYNNIQIDGAVNNDLFGLGSTGAPGGQTQGRAVPLDAVKEFQVLVAPFDVRQGGFVGGLINAVTRSGTNDFEGSFFTYGTSASLVTTTPEPAAVDFSTVQFGGSVAGPIVRDKAHFFLSYDQQVSTRPYSGDIVGTDFDSVGGIGLTRCQQFADRVVALGYSPGSCGGFDFDVPNVNLLAKITAQAGVTGQIELTANYATSSELSMARDRNREYWLTGGGYRIENSNFSPRLKWTNVLGGRFNNELIVGYSRIRDPRTPETDFTPVIVNTGAGYSFVTGAEVNSHQTRTFQDVWELTNNLTFDVGTHRILIGTHNEFFQFLNDFYSRFRGVWTFASLADFDAGIPSQFERNVPAALAGVPGGRGDGPGAEFSVRQFGLYAQDQFSPLPNLTLTFGIRADVPSFPLTPPSNPRLITAMAGTSRKFDTGEFPSGNVHWSPRLGFNYDMGGRGDLIVRGGAGVFTGRPPYVWTSNAFSNSGLEQARLLCTGANIPTFTGLDPDDQPTSCAGPAGLTQSAPDINMFDPEFKFPQSLRFNVGVDKRLPFGLVASVDGMYSNTFNSFHIIDYNLSATRTGWPDTGLGVLSGEGNRLRYGNVAVAGSPVPDRVTSQFRTVLWHFNRGLDYSYSGIFQLQRRFADKFEFTAGYTYSRSFDQMSASNSTASSNFGRAPLDGPITDRNLRPSAFDRPHKISLSGLVHLPYNFSLAMQYVGVSGTPYAYLVQGDANGDGQGSSSNPGSAQNDLFYVPLDDTDITIQNAAGTLTPTEVADRWAALDAFIEQDPCLKDQRGRIMERNSCRNPWQTFLNMNLSWSIQTYRGQRIELSAGLFNVLHWLNEDWGVVKETSFFEGQNIVVRTGWDGANDRNRYDLTLPAFEQVNREASRGRVLLGAKYTF